MPRVYAIWLDRECKVCGKDFKAKEYIVRRGGGKVCSRGCVTEGLRTGVVPNGGRPFTEEEINYVLEEYQKPGFMQRDVAAKFKRATSSISSLMRSLGLTPRKKSHKWRKLDEKEKVIFEEGLPRYTWEELARILDRDIGFLRGQASLLGFRRRNGDTFSAAEFARMMGVLEKKVHKWIDRGMLKAPKVKDMGSQGTYKITVSNAREFLTTYRSDYKIADIPPEYQDLFLSVVFDKE